MTSRHLPPLLSLALLGLAPLAACSDDEPTPASPAPDSGTIQVPEREAGTGGNDSGTVTDAGSDANGDAGDGGSTVGTATNPGSSCLDVLSRGGGGAGDGPYYVRPPGSESVIRVVCDMTRDSGGWTLVASYPLGATTTPAAWSTAAAEGTAFDDATKVFKLGDVMINALKTTAYRAQTRATTCLGGSCSIQNTLYWKPTCTFSSTTSSAACSTAYRDVAFATLTPAGAAPNPCPSHHGLVDYICGTKGGVVTNHDPVSAPGGIFLCVGDLDTDTRACMVRGGETAGLQIWVR